VRFVKSTVFRRRHQRDRKVPHHCRSESHTFFGTRQCEATAFSASRGSLRGPCSCDHRAISTVFRGPVRPEKRLQDGFRGSGTSKQRCSTAPKMAVRDTPPASVEIQVVQVPFRQVDDGSSSVSMLLRSSLRTDDPSCRVSRNQRRCRIEGVTVLNFVNMIDHPPQ